MPPFTPTASERRGRGRTPAGLLLLLLAGAALAASVWPWAEGLAWPGWLRPGPEPEPLLPEWEPGGRGLGWWAQALRPQLAAGALVLLGVALGTHRRQSAALAAAALVLNGWALGATPVRGGWLGGVQTLLAGELGAGEAGWTVLHTHLPGATRLDALAAEVARERPEAVTASGARPGVAQPLTPLLAGYRLAGSRPAPGDAGLAVWVRRDVVSGAARPAGSGGPAALEATLERGEDRLALVVSAGPPPAGGEGPRLVLGGFDAPPWAAGPPGGSGGPGDPGLNCCRRGSSGRGPRWWTTRGRTCRRAGPRRAWPGPRCGRASWRPAAACGSAWPRAPGSRGHRIAPPATAGPQPPKSLRRVPRRLRREQGHPRGPEGSAGDRGGPPSRPEGRGTRRRETAGRSRS